MPEKNIKQIIICKKCGQSICGRTIEKRTNTKLIKKSSKVCKECRSKASIKRSQTMSVMNKSLLQRERVSRRMKKNNPMYNSENKEKVSHALKEKYKDGLINSPFQNNKILKKALHKSQVTRSSFEWKKVNGKKASKRMSKNNPMFRKDVRSKVSETLISKYESGDIVKTVGRDHWLWKGNTNFNKYVRSKLYKVFVRKVMERDNFVCQLCGQTGGRLQVHHTIPLKTIIINVLAQHNYAYDNFDEKVNEDIFVEMANEVVNAHRIKNGITVCARCHGIIDKYYKRKTHEN